VNEREHTRVERHAAGWVVFVVADGDHFTRACVVPDYAEALQVAHAIDLMIGRIVRRAVVDRLIGGQ